MKYTFIITSAAKQREISKEIIMHDRLNMTVEMRISTVGDKSDYSKSLKKKAV